MNQALTLLHESPFSIWVSLPANDVELARAAIRGGAQGLKVHINVAHFASGTRFGSFEEEKGNLARIVEIADGRPVGIVPGATNEGEHNFASEAEFEALAQLGIDFFDAYPADAPAWTLSQPHLDVMLAAPHGATLDEICALQSVGMVLCEASILAHESYGQPLNAADVARYRVLCDSLRVPVMVPSQKKVTPRDLPALQDAGARALLIGAIVTGRDAAGIEAATRSFSEALFSEAH
jgi:hypothetical protein